MSLSIQKTILLVEDEVIIAMMEKAELEQAGFRVLLASNGDKAIELLCIRNVACDVILMDIDLGVGRDGTQIAREILFTHDVPIIFLSSHTENDIVSRTDGIIAYGYVVKHSGIAVLLASIRSALSLHGRHREAPRSAEEPGSVVQRAEPKQKFTPNIDVS